MCILDPVRTICGRGSHDCRSPLTIQPMFSNPAALFAPAVPDGLHFMYATEGMVFGVALMVYPVFVPQTWLIYAIGCVLCLGAVYLARPTP